MTLLSTHEAYGRRFQFEPPVNVGNHKVDSLGKVAALAAVGADANPLMIDTFAQTVDSTLQHVYELTGSEALPQIVMDAVSAFRKSLKVTV